MNLASKINELIIRDSPPARQGVWRWVSRVMPAGLTGLKIALAAALLADAAATDGILGEAMAQVNPVLTARFGRGLSSEDAAIALAAVVLVQDGGTRGMSILQRTLEIAMKPLLSERFQKGMEVGMEKGVEKGVEENQRLWEEWLNRQREAGKSDWDDDPPPSRRE